MGTSKTTILLVDDDKVILGSTTTLLEQSGLGECRIAENGAQALAQLAAGSIDLVLLDLGLPDIAGEDLLARMRQDFPEIPVVIVTAVVDVEMAVQCMGRGAYDYVVKGADPGRLVASAGRALDSRRKDVEIASLRERMLSPDVKNPGSFAAIVTMSERLRVLFRFIEAVAGTREPVLVQGETGTGKELFAQAVHDASGLTGPFVAANLGGLDDHMVSDTLFGHLKGAYTGADDVRPGLIARAAGGTLFLDEIGDLSPLSQVKLLRFLENREYYPLGSDSARKSNARVVAATNRQMEEAVNQGAFRRDLLYRLSPYRIAIPPLRERPEDIPLLCDHFLKQQGKTTSLTSGALAVLRTYSLPGNVRELRGLLLRATALAGGQPIDRAILDGLLMPESGVAAKTPGDSLAFPHPLPTIRETIDSLVSEAILRSGGHQANAAGMLGITPQALSKRLKHRVGPGL